jgi:hypothetical protein
MKRFLRGFAWACAWMSSIWSWNVRNDLGWHYWTAITSMALASIWVMELSESIGRELWQSIATDLYNAHSGSAGQWERSRERYEKAVGK